MEKDGIAAYYLMLRWVATSDLKWSTAAETVLDAWSASLIGFAGHDQMLGTVAPIDLFIINTGVNSRSEQQRTQVTVARGVTSAPDTHCCSHT